MSAGLWEAVAAMLLIAGGALSLIGAVGLVRLRDFFDRMHPVALGATLGCWCVCGASAIVYSLQVGAVMPHALLIPLFVAATVPVTTVMLARAALFRRREAGEDMPPPLSDSPPDSATTASQEAGTPGATPGGR